MNRLKPKKLSSVMIVSIRDLTKAEHDPRFRINMGEWYRSNSHCEPCLAGCVMAFSLKCGPNAGRLTPDSFDSITASKLRAIDKARVGHFSEAVLMMGGTRTDADKAFRLNRDIVGYDRNPALFKKSIRKAARELKEVGL